MYVYPGSSYPISRACLLRVQSVLGGLFQTSAGQRALFVDFILSFMTPIRLNHAGRFFLLFGSFDASCHWRGSGGVHILSSSMLYPGLLLAAMLAGLLIILLFTSK